MESKNDLRQEIHVELQGLHETVKDLRDPTTIKTTTESFHDKWTKRLDQEKAAELRFRSRINEAAREMQTDPRGGWEAIAESALKTNALLDMTEVNINADYRQLQVDIITSVRNVEQGKAPEFPLQSGRQPEKEVQPQPESKPDPERVKNALARLDAINAKRQEREAAKKPEAAKKRED